MNEIQIIENATWCDACGFGAPAAGLTTCTACAEVGNFLAAWKGEQLTISGALAAAGIYPEDAATFCPSCHGEPDHRDADGMCATCVGFEQTARAWLDEAAMGSTWA